MSGWQIAITAAIGVLAPTAAFFGARLGSRANDRATEQRELAARREEWWRRFTWAAELAMDESAAKRALGLSLMMKLARSDLAQQDENDLLDVFHQRALSDILEQADQIGQGK
ncbi:hypothetical protein BS329_18015 [Amycolatopsis coloradensis]|uniref:Uncharacterized protein n=1 Tax=Amycolatopsis coloradensis TaxID=76021 RepID=A0A1R0KT83_9PSEU|nr:hypothetical protein [Amycolatopsis coloradensis]OLZ51137.1 hypothetical protein BS329_18015 [Amycolatopsis coloradensis]